MSVHDHNRRAWDRRAVKGYRFARPVADAELESSSPWLHAGGWLGDPAGQRLLCLAAGGGRQSIEYAKTGAKVTVVDISPRMLALDREAAKAHAVNIRTVEASMDDLSALRDETFDVVIHPVSTCYVPDVAAVFAEVARVLVDGGLYISQHKQPASLQADAAASARGYELIEPYYCGGPLPGVAGSLHREAGTLEFLHRWEELIGGMCRAGFVIEDLVEPHHADADAPPGDFKHRSRFVPPYVRIKARRTAERARRKEADGKGIIFTV